MLISVEDMYSPLDLMMENLQFLIFLNLGKKNSLNKLPASIVKLKADSLSIVQGDKKL